MKKKQTYNQDVNGDEGFVAGDAYPSCEGESCANVAQDTEEESANVSEQSATEAEPKESADDTVAKLNAEIADWRDKYMRLQAEFDNFRKRTLREKMDLVQNGGSEIIKAMLPVLDDVQRAVEASEKSDDIEALREGERLVAQKFINALQHKNVTEIEAVGKDFDADLHEAVAKFDAGKDKKGKVIDVVQRGYMLGDKVIRFAKVVVGE